MRLNSPLMIKRAEEREEKQRRLRSSEAAAVAMAPLPVHLVMSALAAGKGSEADRKIMADLLRAGRSEGIKFKKYPSESGLQRVLRLISGRFKTGMGYKQPAVEGMTPEQAKTVFTTHPEKLTWGDVAGKKIIYRPGSSGMLAHEMGHMSEKDLHPALQIMLEQILPAAGTATGTIGALRAKSPREARMLGNIGALMAAGSAVPSLFNEAAASVRGLTALNRAGASRGALMRQGFGKMLPAFVSHAATKSVLPIATLLASRLIAQGKKKKEDEK